MTASADDFVRLTDAANQVEAGVIRELLENNGIQCFVKGENVSSLYGGFGANLFGFDVMVRHADVERAARLLTQLREAEPIWDEDPDDDDDDEQARSSPALSRGRDPGIALRRALVPSFGFGHFYTGAFASGAVLALTQIAGLALLSYDVVLGAGVAGVAVATDALGARARARQLAQRAGADPTLPELPRARALPPGGAGGER